VPKKGGLLAEMTRSPLNWAIRVAVFVALGFRLESWRTALVLAVIGFATQAFLTCSTRGESEKGESGVRRPALLLLQALLLLDLIRQLIPLPQLPCRDLLAARQLLNRPLHGEPRRSGSSKASRTLPSPVPRPGT
jgi:hypothetical protein